MPVLPEEFRKARLGEYLLTSVALEFGTIVGADGSCPFVPGVLAWPVAYTQLPRLTGKGDETRASFASSITFGDMLREKLDHGKNLLRI